MIIRKGFICKPYRENTIHPIFCCGEVPHELNLQLVSWKLQELEKLQGLEHSQCHRSISDPPSPTGFQQVVRNNQKAVKIIFLP